MGECSKQERAQIAEEASWKHRGEVDGDLQGRGAFLQSVLGWPRSLVLVFRAVHGAWGSVHIWLCGRAWQVVVGTGRSVEPAGQATLPPRERQKMPPKPTYPGVD